MNKIDARIFIRARSGLTTQSYSDPPRGAQRLQPEREGRFRSPVRGGIFVGGMFIARASPVGATSSGRCRSYGAAKFISWSFYKYAAPTALPPDDPELQRPGPQDTWIATGVRGPG